MNYEGSGFPESRPTFSRDPTSRNRPLLALKCLSRSCCVFLYISNFTPGAPFWIRLGPLVCVSSTIFALPYKVLPEITASYSRFDSPFRITLSTCTLLGAACVPRMSELPAPNTRQCTEELVRHSDPCSEACGTPTRTPQSGLHTAIHCNMRFARGSFHALPAMRFSASLPCKLQGRPQVHLRKSPSTAYSAKLSVTQTCVLHCVSLQSSCMKTHMSASHLHSARDVLSRVSLEQAWFSLACFMCTASRNAVPSCTEAV